MVSTWLACKRCYLFSNIAILHSKPDYGSVQNTSSYTVLLTARSKGWKTHQQTIGSIIYTYNSLDFMMIGNSIFYLTQFWIYTPPPQAFSTLYRLVFTDWGKTGCFLYVVRLPRSRRSFICLSLFSMQHFWLWFFAILICLLSCRLVQFLARIFSSFLALFLFSLHAFCRYPFGGIRK